ncbi:lactaldehyde dehydrogenase [Saccharopolyspora erythraea NRRL 2338]|uniref:Aldehyde dehydrogenase family protein n=2 Tax=Saccharopolyspora erythraea TaxID=1836 RepID=A0ABN1DTK0_SACER|nr:aldehyde dehydrogenase [Saccharopolyspora erythraea D]PFG97852.1 lactaldehyde dehydrogenase [Saccharopolyspora erythraea NRRL 2338]QRK93773.1 aldehyde dehydrogenase family protein [Saccharopolyspora erythraea]
MIAATSARTVSSQWIGGEWVPSDADDGIAVIDPSDESTVATVPAGTATDARRAVAAARAAADSWARTSATERIRFLERLVAGLKARADELADSITTEAGVPTRVAQRAQVGLAIEIAESFADITAKFEFERRVGNSLVVREPAGVVVTITPWNVPLLLSLQKIVPALMAGCTVVHKPSELAPTNSYLLAEIIAECDLPPGVFNLVVGEGAVAGAELAGHPEVDLVSFTGSVRAGREIGRQAAEQIKRLHLELGGKSASIVLEDADLEPAVRATVDQVCFNTGQTCLQWSRLLVPSHLQQQALELAGEIAGQYKVGPPRDPTTDLGPLVSSAGLERVRGHIRTGIEEGARLVAGGAEVVEGLQAGYYVRPTVFGDVTESMRTAREEIFGPVLSVLPYDGEKEAIRIANATPYGLHGAIWSGSSDRAQRVARQVRTGQSDINGGAFNILAPFGGMKQSGIGRECGVEGLDGFCELKSLQFPDRSAKLVGPHLRDEKQP